MAQALKGGREKTSSIWKYFEVIENNQARCNHCKSKIVRGKPSAPQKNLTNSSLWNHLERMHPHLHKEAFAERKNFMERKEQEKVEKEKKKDIYVFGENQLTLEGVLGRKSKWAPTSHSQVC